MENKDDNNVKTEKVKTYPIVLREDYIKLGQALKVIGAVSSGVEAKIIIQSGIVSVNGEISLQRGRKLYAGDIVELEDNRNKYRAEIL